MGSGRRDGEKGEGRESKTRPRTFANVEGKKGWQKETKKKDTLCANSS